MERPWTPECNKLTRTASHRSLLFEFLDFLEGEGLEITKNGDWTGESRDSLVFRFFGIDAKKLEEERRALLEWSQKLAEDEPPTGWEEG